MLSNPEAIEIIKAKIHQVGGMAQFESKYDVTVGHLRAVCAGRMEPGKRTARAAGLVRTEGGWRFL